VHVIKNPDRKEYGGCVPTLFGDPKNWSVVEGEIKV